MKKVVPQDAILIPDNAKCVFQGIIYSVYQWRQPLFGDAVATFEMLKRPDTTSAICIVDDKILVLSEEQPHRGHKMTFPGGRVDPTDESPLAAIQREVHEETGYTFDHWRLVRAYQPEAKLEWFIYYFVAWGVRRHDDPHDDAGEKITIQHLDLAEVKLLVAQKEGFLGESQDVFARVQTIQDLRQLSEFSGREVDR